METFKEILRIIISWPAAIIAICVTVIILRESIGRLCRRLVASEHGKAKVGPMEIDFGKPQEQVQKGVSKSEETELESPKEKETPVTEQGVQPLLGKVLNLLYSEKNYQEAQKVFREEVEPKLNEDTKLLWEAVVLRISHQIGDLSAFEKLETIVKENETNPQLIKQLALRYKEMGEFEKAKEKFLLAKDKLDISDESKRDLIVDCYIESSWCLANDDKYNASIDMLKQILGKSEFQDQKAKILSAMAYIAKDKEVVEDFICYAEASLNTDPLDTDLRFKVAYAYSNMGYAKLALLHYKKLLDISTNSTALNNIGVCYGNLKLKGKSISSYLRSAEEKETLAMSNLAYNYLDAGFLNNANELIEKANKLSAEGIEVNPGIGSALRKLENLKKEENKCETKFLKEAEQERKFMFKYSEARLRGKSIINKDWEGPWKTPWGEMKIKLDKASNSFQAKFHTKEEDKLASAFAPSYGFLQPNKIYKERDIVIDGRISRLTGRYTIQINDSNVATTLMTAGAQYSSTGYIVINESYDRIEIMEKTADDKTEFREWIKVGGEEPIKSEVKNS